MDRKDTLYILFKIYIPTCIYSLLDWWSSRIFDSTIYPSSIYHAIRVFMPNFDIHFEPKVWTKILKIQLHRIEDSSLFKLWIRNESNFTSKFQQLFRGYLLYIRGMRVKLRKRKRKEKRRTTSSSIRDAMRPVGERRVGSSESIVPGIDVSRSFQRRVSFSSSSSNQAGERSPGKSWDDAGNAIWFL